jgi:hypothetical protein
MCASRDHVRRLREWRRGAAQLICLTTRCRYGRDKRDGRNGDRSQRLL